MPFIPIDAAPSKGAINRIAIIGPPGSGKTTSLLTFPDLIVFDRDKNCPADVLTIPAWNPDWADNLVKRTFNNLPNFRDAIIKWFRENHDKFEPEQTFALDSWSFIQDACDLQTNAEDDNAGVGKSGNKDSYFFWKQKLKYSKAIAEYLKSMKCRVVVTMHEAIDRDAEGRPNGKIRPVQDGSYKDYVLGVFNNVWRMRGNMPVKKENEIAKRLDGKKVPVETTYYWQLFGDSIIDLKLDSSLSQYVKKHNIDKVEIVQNGTGISGGFKTIQEIYSAIQRGET
jgi:hypothetical protein